MDTARDPRFRAWSLIVDLYAMLWPVYAEQQASMGMSMSDFDVLINLLLTEDNQARMGALSERTVISFSRVSRVVDELERKGLVERTADPDDGRAVVIKLSPTGRKQIRAAARAHADSVMENFANHISLQEAEMLIELFERVMAAHGRSASPTQAWRPTD